MGKGGVRGREAVEVEVEGGGGRVRGALMSLFSLRSILLVLHFHDFSYKDNYLYIT